MNDGRDIELIIAILRQFWAELIKNSPGAMLKLMRRADLSLPQLVALLFVHKRTAVSISEIGEHLNLSLGATSHLVDRLFVNGFVERVEAQLDRRQKQVTLTAAGTAFVEEAQHARVEEMARALATLPAPLLERLLTDLGDAIAHLSAEEPAVIAER